MHGKQKGSQAMDHSSSIFDNQMNQRVIRSAQKKQQKYLRKFGDDRNTHYVLGVQENACIGPILGVKNLSIIGSENISSTDTVNQDATQKSQGHIMDEEPHKTDLQLVPKSLIVGNIRMGFGHYRISMAIASAAHAMGYTPYWMDLNSYQETTGGKVINAQNELYSLGSRLSGKSRIFNKLVWEPMNYEGFRKLSYNAADQKNAELMTPVFCDIPKDTPYVATHVWPAQAAIHAGMTNVVNAVPDNWPMALHLSEGSIHTIQTHASYLGYRVLNGMSKNQVLSPMSSRDLVYTGHYIDHELVSNIEKDCDARIARASEGKPIRFLLTIGGAGAQKEIFSAIVKYLLPYIREKKAALFINVGDYENVWKELVAEIPSLQNAERYFDDWERTRTFVKQALSEAESDEMSEVRSDGALEAVSDGAVKVRADEPQEIEGIYAFCHHDIFEAVYTTNLLMRLTDVLVTKPSELSFYPVPKLFIKRVGGHEQWGAIHSAEIGDGTLECQDIPHTLQMVHMFMEEKELLTDMCENIKKNHQIGIYSGAYKVVELATKTGGLS